MACKEVAVQDFDNIIICFSNTCSPMTSFNRSEVNVTMSSIFRENSLLASDAVVAIGASLLLIEVFFGSWSVFVLELGIFSPHLFYCPLMNA